MTGVDLFAELERTQLGRHLLDELQRYDEKAQQRFYRTCEDGWVVAYTTSPVVNGPDAGRFLMLVYKPVGKGARGGRRTAQSWELHQRRAFAKRRSAKARAEQLWRQHEAKGKGR